MTAQQPAPESVSALARVIWHTSRADESTISATGANIVSREALAFLRDAIHGDGPESDAIRAALRLDAEWGIQFERKGDPTMDNPAGIRTHVQAMSSEATARQAVKNHVPITAVNRRVVARVVGDWREVPSQAERKATQP